MLGFRILGVIKLGMLSIVSRLKIFELMILFSVKLFLFLSIFVIFVVSLGRFVLNVIIVSLIIKFEMFMYLVIFIVEFIKK